MDTNSPFLGSVDCIRSSSFNPFDLSRTSTFAASSLQGLFHIAFEWLQVSKRVLILVMIFDIVNYGFETSPLAFYLQRMNGVDYHLCQLFVLGRRIGRLYVLGRRMGPLFVLGRRIGHLFVLGRRIGPLFVLGTRIFARHDDERCSRITSEGKEVETAVSTR